MIGMGKVAVGLLLVWLCSQIPFFSPKNLEHSIRWIELMKSRRDVFVSKNIIVNEFAAYPDRFVSRPETVDPFLIQAKKTEVIHVVFQVGGDLLAVKKKSQKVPAIIVGVGFADGLSRDYPFIGSRIPVSNFLWGGANVDKTTCFEDDCGGSSNVRDEVGCGYNVSIACDLLHGPRHSYKEIGPFECRKGISGGLSSIGGADRGKGQKNGKSSQQDRTERGPSFGRKHSHDALKGALIGIWIVFVAWIMSKKPKRKD